MFGTAPMLRSLWILYITQETVCPTHLSSTSSHLLSVFSSHSPSILCDCRGWLKQLSCSPISSPFYSFPVFHTQLLPVFLIIFYCPSLEIKSTFQSGCPYISAHYPLLILTLLFHLLLFSILLACLSLIPLLLLAPFPFLPPSPHPSPPMIILIASSSRSTTSAFPFWRSLFNLCPTRDLTHGAAVSLIRTISPALQLLSSTSSPSLLSSLPSPSGSIKGIEGRKRKRMK